MASVNGRLVRFGGADDSVLSRRFVDIRPAQRDCDDFRAHRSNGLCCESSEAFVMDSVWSDFCSLLCCSFGRPGIEGRYPVLEMRTVCESCSKSLAHDAKGVFICSFECTFCSVCAETKLGYTCPNCGGNLVARPTRQDNRLAVD